MSTTDSYELVIRGGTIYDGTGVDGVRADVGVSEGRIVAVGTLAARGANELNASGMAVAPGFIDVHSHDDYAVMLEPTMDFKVLQGVTTDIVGNCGSGVVPFEAGLSGFRRQRPDANPPPWAGLAGYMQYVDEVGPSLNVAVLLGAGTLRLGAMDLAQRRPTESELELMRSWIQEGMEAGAVGLSTGLIYEPGRYAETEELVTLARTVASKGGLYTTHMRNEGVGLLDSVREAIHIGEEAGIPVQISHHKATGQENWGKVRESLALIEAARARGVDVTADQYPYTASSTILHAVVQNGMLFRTVLPEGVIVAAAPKHPAYEGRSLAAIADDLDLAAEDAAAQLVEEEGKALWVVLFMMDESDVRTVLAHPTTMIGSDGVPAVGGKPHPRLYGTFARVLGHYVREEKVLDLPTALHRMTGMPAKKFQLVDRGVIRPGAHADLVVFDPARITDAATYEDPRRHPDGIEAVYVNGLMVARAGKHTGARPGRIVRRGMS